MGQAFFSPVSFVRQRVSAWLHRKDQLKAGAAERRARWNRVLVAQQKPPAQPPDTSKP
jgi:hypothetical protein